MKIIRALTVFSVVSMTALTSYAQTSNDAAVQACQSTGLIALKQRAPEVTDLVLDMETLAVSAADTTVEDVAVKTVIMGDAYIARGGQTGKPDRFVCLIGDKGKVLLTFFTAQ